MSAIVTKKRISKKEEFKTYLLELLQEDPAFRQEVYKLLFTTSPLPHRSKEEWQALSASSSIKWSDIQELQELFRETN